MQQVAQATIEQIQDLARKGETLHAIARTLHVAYGTARKYACQLLCDSQPQVRTPRPIQIRKPTFSPTIEIITLCRCCPASLSLEIPTGSAMVAVQTVRAAVVTCPACQQAYVLGQLLTEEEIYWQYDCLTHFLE